MKATTLMSVIMFLLGVGCAGSVPPTQQMADVQAANRSATELGAERDPRAQLHLKLAEEQMRQAEVAMNDGDNERAESLLMRAKADAELAVALTREDAANTEASNAVDQSNSQRSTNIEQGAAQ